jgi:hypothetical protein
VFDNNELSKEQKPFATVFYWAAYLGNPDDEKDVGKLLVDIFLKEYGFSPFCAFYRDKSPVVGTIV